MGDTQLVKTIIDRGAARRNDGYGKSRGTALAVV